MTGRSRAALDEHRAEACSKCGAEPRSGKSSMGNACLAAVRRERRTCPTPTPTVSDLSDSDTRTPESDAAPPVASRSVARRLAAQIGACPFCAGKDGTIATLTARIAELESGRSRLVASTNGHGKAKDVDLCARYCGKIHEHTAERMR